jgi:hypothetical protein
MGAAETGHREVIRDSLTGAKSILSCSGESAGARSGQIAEGPSWLQANGFLLAAIGVIR